MFCLFFLNIWISQKIKKLSLSHFQLHPKSYLVTWCPNSCVVLCQEVCEAKQSWQCLCEYGNNIMFLNHLKYISECLTTVGLQKAEICSKLSNRPTPVNIKAMSVCTQLRGKYSCIHVQSLNDKQQMTSNVKQAEWAWKTGAKLLQNLFFWWWVMFCRGPLLRPCSPRGQICRGLDQHLLSDASGCVLFTLQIHAAGVWSTSTAPAASCPTTHAPRSCAPTGESAYPSLKVTYATARWTTPTHGKHKLA